MDILLVAATAFEIAPTLAFLEQNFENAEGQFFTKNELRVQTLVTGVGAMPTAWHLGQSLALRRPSWVVNAGVAGAYDRSLELGMVVQVIRDQFGDLGVEEADGRFTDVFELGLTDHNEAPFINGHLHNPAAGQTPFLPVVNALTVNRVHGQSGSISAIRTKYPSTQIETMESAAIFYGCLLAQVPFSAIRSISNYVEPRNRDAWELGLAIEQLNLVLKEILESLRA